MARTLWGKVYFKDTYAGRLQEEPGGRCVFTYDPTYLSSEQPAAIAHTLPLRAGPHISERGLHPFFDNLVAEGWFRNAQARALGIDPGNRFALLLGFGHDLAGAVSVEDPEPAARMDIDHADEATIAALLGRASLSGVQRKLLVLKEGRSYRPVGPNELSTHIAKLPSGNLTDLLELEYLTTLAVRTLLPGEEIVDMDIVHLQSIKENALIIPRFDRTGSGKRLIHFEEFNQLLGKYSGDDKYDGAYEDLGQFILRTPSCIPVEADRLLRRILTCLLVGNTDAHFKNFAMFHTRDGLRLAPAYDLVAASFYPEYQSIALSIAGARNMAIGLLQAKHLVRMAEGFGVNEDALVSAVEQLGKRLPTALAALEGSDVGPKPLRERLKERMEKRWNGSFASTGPLLSKKRSKGGKAKS
ncbi:MAG TPA: HipA domain-containing protein [Steroidobacteraceae bacterium]|nr:HipA domain-containing protein [Steroidobacteraceae bacterium]